MSKSKMKEIAKIAKENGTLVNVSGNDIWKHEFYKMPMGNLIEVSYKNGRFAECNNLGR